MLMREKGCPAKISARLDTSWFSSNFGETPDFLEVAFLLQDGAACAPSREEKVKFLLMLPLDQMVLSPPCFCDEKSFSVVQLL